MRALGARNLWSKQPLAPHAEDIITGLELPVDLPCDPSWAIKMKKGFSLLFQGHFEATELLLRSGLPYKMPGSRTWNGLTGTPLEMARHCGHERVEGLLKRGEEQHKEDSKVCIYTTYEPRKSDGITTKKEFLYFKI